VKPGQVVVTALPDKEVDWIGRSIATRMRQWRQ